MSISRNVVKAVAGTIAGLAGLTLALLPAAVIANSAAPGAETGTVYQVAAPATPASDFPWN